MKIGLNVSNQGLVQQTQNLTGPEKFQQTLSGVTSALAGAAGAAAPFFPGGAVVSAALSGFANTAQQASMNGGGVGPFGGAGGSGSSGVGDGMSGMGAAGGMPGGGDGMPGMGAAGGMPGGMGGAGGPPGSPQAQMQQGFAQQMYLMGVQQKAQQQSEVISMMSNLLKVKHDSDQSVIQNIH